MGRVEQYRAELKRLTDWEPYLKKNSGLPGARANLAVSDPVPIMSWLRELAADPRWRVREGNLAKARIAALGPSWVAKWRRKAKRDTRKEVVSEATSIQSGDT
jgi:hypothetical protein